jgi:hypothetical protein
MLLIRSKLGGKVANIRPAACDRIREDAGVLRVTFVISLVFTAVCAVMTLLWAMRRPRLNSCPVKRATWAAAPCPRTRYL